MIGGLIAPRASAVRPPGCEWLGGSRVVRGQDGRQRGTQRLVYRQQMLRDAAAEREIVCEQEGELVGHVRTIGALWVT